jgi:hypothetical protein
MSIPAIAEIPNTRRKRGRPALAFQTEPLPVRMSSDALARLDDWRRRQDDLPTRPEAIRRLTELVLSRPRGTAV